MFASLIVLVAANGWTFVFITAKHGTGKDRAKWAKEGPVQDMPKLGGNLATLGERYLNISMNF